VTDIQTPLPEPAAEPLAPESAVEPQPFAPPKPTSALDVIWEFVQTILLALVIFLLIRNVVQNYRIDGISMEPNFHNGQFLFVNRYAYCPGIHLEVPLTNVRLYDKVWCVWPPRRGDVIVFEYPLDLSRDFIKRVIGLPGETVEVKAGKIYIDGKLLPEPFGPNPSTRSSPPVKVGPNQVFVMGDNRDNSSDSRTWGLLPQNDIVGKAWVSYWPPKNWAIVPHYDLTNFASAAP
jgi:signal peptidase I